MKRDATLYLKDMLDQMEKAEGFIAGLSEEGFAKDEKTQYAVLRCIEVIGEAAKHVPAGIRKKYPKVPWRDMAGMRDKVIHFYFDVNVKRVWLALMEDIPAIQPILQMILKEIRE
ncbi:DUF86 domain-containing protein [candidate division TA06 bacterium]|uniref:DUF86 domain-containing protein n=1 Tax=candidate division TA06 bacterium TaxID=2250710 RepID=A0A933MKI9_UNCT6|nr:DUF86 domain-containing protein [candidate division TA06 bacterium]